MFKTVVAALNEASDITLHLMPLIAHFKVIMIQLTFDILTGDEKCFNMMRQTWQTSVGMTWYTMTTLATWRVHTKNVRMFQN